MSLLQSGLLQSVLLMTTLLVMTSVVTNNYTFAIIYCFFKPEKSSLVQSATTCHRIKINICDDMLSPIDCHRVYYLAPK